MKTLIVLSLLIALMPVAATARQTNTTDRRIEAEVMKVLDDYMEAWNRKDLAAWERTFHFPHYRLASGRMNVLDKPGMQDAARV